MKRREFIAASAALLVSPRPSLAQETPRRVGTFGNVQNLPIQKVFNESLRGHGWIEGKNLIIDYRYFEGHAERLPALAVAVAVADPVRLGLVQSLSHPGGNMTGLSLFVPGNFTGKAIQALRELVPTASKIANLVNPGNPFHMLTVAEELPQIARNLGVALPVFEATTAEEIDIAFASAAAQHADAIYVFGDTLTVNNAPRITALATKHRLPASYLYRQFVINGGLISYGTHIADLFVRAGGYVDRILKGAKPSDLPVEQPTKFELVINLKTAKALGLTVPPSLLARADEVIE